MRQILLFALFGVLSGGLIGCSDRGQKQEPEFDKPIAPVETNHLESFLVDTAWRGANGQDQLQYRFEKNDVVLITGDVAKKYKYNARGRWSAYDTGVCKSYKTNPQTGEQYDIRSGNLWIEASGDGGNKTCCLDISVFNQNNSMSMQRTSSDYSESWWCQGIIMDVEGARSVDDHDRLPRTNDRIHLSYFHVNDKRKTQEDVNVEKGTKSDEETERLGAEKASQEKEALLAEQMADELAEESQGIRQQAALSGRLKLVEEYKGRIQMKIKGLVINPPGLRGKPEAVYRVDLLPNGEVVRATLLKGSGQPTYDRAVESAILKASPFPLPPDREASAAFRGGLELLFRPD